MRRAIPWLAAVLVACGGQPALPPRDTAASAEFPLAIGQTPFDSTPSVREVLQSSALVGHRVIVTGHCVAPTWGYQLGRPPRLVSGWQLEADGVAVFVIGGLPSSCGEPSGDTLVSITALVAEDTLPPLADLPASPRRYLLLLHTNGPR